MDSEKESGQTEEPVKSWYTDHAGNMYTEEQVTEEDGKCMAGPVRVLLIVDCPPSEVGTPDFEEAKKAAVDLLLESDPHNTAEEKEE